MANLSEDIQCAGSDTRPPMLDMTDFALWQQRIRLYCWGKEKGVNILKSIDEGPYQMGTVQEPLAEGTEGTPQFGPERPRHKGESIHDYYVRFAKLINDMRNIKMTMSRMQLNSKFVNNMLPEWGRFVTPVKLNRGLRDSNYDQLAHCKELHSIKATTELRILQRQDVADAGSIERSSFGRRAAIADDCDKFDSDVDEAPTAQTMFMVNLSSADPVTDEAGPSYDSDILSKVQDHDYYQDAVYAHHEEYAMHDNVQLNHVVNSHANYTSDSNMILYDQYVKGNEVPVVHSNVSSVLNDAFMMIYSDMCEPHA
uniref:Retrovirus-related Pol polyprotein from transposon TNT 1-94 n=1 Tax=Tanacetum cinerariifolium TaxID=118510 RepID=A0A699HAY5_TANCI|nr:retrovirus-related Pol polyprotein from transposon TNT 1-94 [Tanacetum cinerariifolium]